MLHTRIAHTGYRTTGYYSCVRAAMPHRVTATDTQLILAQQWPLLVARLTKALNHVQARAYTFKYQLYCKHLPCVRGIQYTIASISSVTNTCRVCVGIQFQVSVLSQTPAMCAQPLIQAYNFKYQY